jgi:hypothetical protein
MPLFSSREFTLFHCHIRSGKNDANKRSSKKNRTGTTGKIKKEKPYFYEKFLRYEEKRAKGESTAMNDFCVLITNAT